QPGNMETLTGEVKGKHDGLMYHTLGQRHGLGIGGPGEPWIVVGKNVKENILYVEQGYHHEALYADAHAASRMKLAKGIPEKNTFTRYAKSTCRKGETKVFVTVLENGSVREEFEEP